MSSPPGPAAAPEHRAAWWPLRRRGTRYRTHKLVVRRGRLDFETGLNRRLGAWVMTLPALLVIGLFAWVGGPPDLPIALAGFLFAAGWLGAAGYYYYLYPAVRFDREHRRVERTRLPLLLRAQRIPFENLRAIQILRETWLEHSAFGSVRVGSYELNLVLKDGRRANVADHADLDYLRENARRLRAFLGIPIWDRADRDAPPAPVSARERVVRAAWQIPVGLLALAASAGLLLIWPPGLSWLELADFLLGVVMGGLVGLALVTNGIREWRRGRPPRLG